MYALVHDALVHVRTSGFDRVAASDGIEILRECHNEIRLPVEVASYMPHNESVSTTTVRRFPFRAADEHDRARANRDIANAIEQHATLIQAAVVTRLPRRLQSHVEDVEQEVKIALWRDALPRFDADRGYKLGTYIFTCAHRAISAELRRLKAEQRPGRLPSERFLLAPDCGSDRLIEQLADMILAEPERFLSEFGANVLRAVTESPDQRRGAVADLARLDRQQIWKGLYKVRQKLRKVLGEVGGVSILSLGENPLHRGASA